MRRAVLLAVGTPALSAAVVPSASAGLLAPVPTLLARRLAGSGFAASRWP